MISPGTPNCGVGPAVHSGDYATQPGRSSAWIPETIAHRLRRFTSDGILTEFATGLIAVLGLAFDSDGRHYALETSADAAIFLGTGWVVRRAKDRSWEVVAMGLVFPTCMTFDDRVL